MSAVDVGVAEEPADAVHHRDHRGVHQPGLAELADVELDVGSLDPDQGVEAVALAPGEPATQLERVEVVGATGVAGQVGHRGQLGRRHRQRLERQKSGGTGHGGHLKRRDRGGLNPARRRRGEALEQPDATPRGGVLMRPLAAVGRALPARIAPCAPVRIQGGRLPPTDCGPPRGAAVRTGSTCRDRRQLRVALWSGTYVVCSRGGRS